MLYTGWFWELTHLMNRTTWLLQESRFPMMISLILRSMTMRKEVGMHELSDDVSWSGEEGMKCCFTRLKWLV